ncbi:hypothetical protein DB30_07528 [Enhygromyxa salina]|uniref:Uncharacterized protein n=1 Tax=Enhygromyxa salina TaxID=215803 RepID=A0A0C2CW12_9BACT|nr:hypothetical protein DB30_07528 [Enhygromyxa salina]
MTRASRAAALFVSVPLTVLTVAHPGVDRQARARQTAGAELLIKPEVRSSELAC